MIKNLKVEYDFHSFGTDEDGEPFRKYYVSITGEYKGHIRIVATALKHEDDPFPWIDKLYAQLVEEFEKEQPNPQNTQGSN